MCNNMPPSYYQTMPDILMNINKGEVKKNNGALSAPVTDQVMGSCQGKQCHI